MPDESDDRAREQVVFRWNALAVEAEEAIDGETVLLNTTSNVVYMLNATATRIWSELKAGTSVAATLEALSAQTGDARLRDGVTRFFDDLQQFDLIRRAGAGGALAWPGSVWGTVELPAIVRWTRVSEEQQSAYFAEAVETTRAVEARVGSTESCYRIAGVTIRVVSASPALQAILFPALAACRTNCDDWQATLHVWDGASSGRDLPAPCHPQHFTPDGEVLGMASDVHRIAFHWSDYAISLANEATATAVFWVADPDGLTAATRRRPFLPLLTWILQWRGRTVLPVSAAAVDGEAVLLVNEASGGLLDAATALGRAGLDLIAEDYVVAQEAAGGVLVSALYPRAAPALPVTAILARQASPDAPLAAAPRDRVEARLLERLSRMPRAGPAARRVVARLCQTASCEVLPVAAPGDEVAHAIRQATSAAAGARGRPSPRLTVSVVVPIYNEVGYLHAALESVAAQGVTDLEVIVVDDGSQRPVARTHADLPLDPRILRQDNAGPAAARNLGIQAARGDLIAFLDADDLWPEGRLTRMIQAFRAEPWLDAVMGFGQLFRHPTGGTTIETMQALDEAFPFYIGSTLFRRAAFVRVGLFDPELRFAEDTDWFYRARESLLQIKHLQEVTLLVRRHGGNMTADRSLVELGELRAMKKKHDRLFWRDRPSPDWPRDPFGLRTWPC